MSRAYQNGNLPFHSETTLRLQTETVSNWFICKYILIFFNGISFAFLHWEFIASPCDSGLKELSKEVTDAQFGRQCPGTAPMGGLATRLSMPLLMSRLQREAGRYRPPPGVRWDGQIVECPPVSIHFELAEEIRARISRATISWSLAAWVVLCGQTF